MAAEKKKVYGNMRIMSIQGKDLFCTEAITALKNGKLNADKFDGIHYVRYKRSAGSSRDGRHSKFAL